MYVRGSDIYAPVDLFFLDRDTVCFHSIQKGTAVDSGVGDDAFRCVAIYLINGVVYNDDRRLRKGLCQITAGVNFSDTGIVFSIHREL